MDAVTNKNNRRVEVGSGLAGFVFRNNLAAIGQIDRLAAGRNKCKLGLVFDGVNGNQRNLLEVSPLVASGLKAIERELGRNVLRGKLGSACAGTAALEQIQRQKSHVGANLFGINGYSSGASGWWQTSHRRNVCCGRRLLRERDTRQKQARGQ